MHGSRAVFLDRDGVINPLIYHQDAGIVDSPFTLSQFNVFPHVPRAIRLLNDMGMAVIVISNQPGIAKRHFDANLLSKFNEKLERALKKAGARIDAIYYCLHHPDSKVKTLRKRCTCRKPGIGMLTRAAREFGLSLSESYMVGDGLTDIQAGSRAGCRTVFIGTWKCECCQFIRPSTLHPTFVAKDLWEAVKRIRADQSAASTTSSTRLSRWSSSGQTQVSDRYHPVRKGMGGRRRSIPK
jgi:D-glycero-D-manno-heptose 1,7-bisphosphate phosphatase